MAELPNIQYSIFNIQSPDANQRRRGLLAVLSGLLLTASFPLPGISWLSWIALVPLLISLRDLGARDGFRMGLLAGLVHYMTLLYWLAYTMVTYGNFSLLTSISVLFFLSFYLALFTAIFAAVLTGLCKAPWACCAMAPVLWVSLEYLRSFVLTGFPWELLGYSQFKNLHLIQISDIFGVYGVSFVIAALNGAVFLAFLWLSERSWQDAAVTKRLALGSMAAAALALIAALLYGKWSIQSVDEIIGASPSVQIGVVQGNIDQSLKWNPAFQKATVEKYVGLSQRVGKEKPDLVVWPETAVPFYYLYNAGLTREVQKGIIETRSDFLIGSPSFVLRDGAVHYYNSAYLVGADGTVQDRYDKVRLVPFGEYVPYKKWFPFLGKMVAHVGDFEAGEEGKVVKWRDGYLAVQVCYEIIFAELTRELVRNNATLVVNVTNDAWYGRTSAPYQHYSMAVFRAVENRRSLVRSANTGISGFVGPVGRTLASTEIFADSADLASVPVLRQQTVYTRFGDFFAVICLATALLLALNGVRTRRHLTTDRASPLGYVPAGRARKRHGD